MANKRLRLTFKTEGSGTMDVSISDPQEELTLTTVKAQAADMIPVFQTKSGLSLTELFSAAYVETTETELA